MPATRVPMLFATALVAMAMSGCGGTAASLAAEDEGLIVLRRSEGEDPKTIDPHKAGDTGSSRHCSLCYESLLEYDFLERPAKLVPCTAAAMPTYDAATLTYTFRLRDDVYFQDDRCFHPEAAGRTYSQEGERRQSDRGKGRRLTAHDYVWSFKRLSALPDSEGFWLFEHKIVGIDAFHTRAMDLYTEDPEAWREHLNHGKVEGIWAPDDFTFCVRFVEPYPQFLYAIAMSYGAAMAREAVEYYGPDIARKPVGTGPFVLKRWRFNMELVWERSPTFRDQRFPTSTRPEHERFRAFMGRRLPIADRVHFRIIKESQPEFLEFLQGNLDVAGIDKDQFSTALTPQHELTPLLKDKGIQLRTWEDPYMSYIALNMDDNDIGAPAGARGLAVRRALCLCIDRDDLIRRYLNGRGSPARHVIPASTFGYSEDSAMSWQRYDPAEGRRQLEAAGFRVESIGRDLYRTVDPATGKQVSITVLIRRNDQQSADYAVFLKSSGDKVGIRIDSERMTFAEWLKRSNDRVGQAFDSGWIMDYPDAQNNLQLLYGPNTAQGLNYSGYNSETYNRMYRELAPLDEADETQRARKGELVRLMHAELDKDLPWVMLNWNKTYSLFHSWYTLPDPNPFAYTYTKFVHADTPRRGELATSWARTPVLPGLLLSLLFFVPAALLVSRVIRQAL
ncbi:MAG: hypothetical protein HS108_12705 [Planctomycetes bacterium]|jgi:ABC-type transport system substrate-binding protein|nr:hypothetical protein [Planctomycetota bacterium]MCL4729595.1 hypothetical protein [Planctomycetota bacterium]